MVYCVEGVDHGGQALLLILPDDSQPTRVERPDLLGGVTIIEAPGRRVSPGSFGGVETMALRLVPYYTWSHRGIGPMTVWMPRAARDAPVP